MADDFSKIPSVVIDYVRKVFAAANDKVSQTVLAALERGDFITLEEHRARNAALLAALRQSQSP